MKLRGCKPACSVENTFVRNVLFKNGDQHSQLVCKVCRKTKYVPRQSHTSVPLDHMEIALSKQAEQRRALYGDGFYSTAEWLRVRYEAFVHHGKICAACGSTDGPLHVDHIKPRARYPQLALRVDNLQILCKECNLGKGAWDETSWNSKNEK